MQFLARRDDEAQPRGDLATQGSNFNMLLGRGRQRHSEGERCGRDAEVILEDSFNSSYPFGQISDATPARCANAQRR